MDLDSSDMVGIDLGTTCTAVSALKINGEAIVIVDGHSARVFNSTVSARKENAIVYTVGENAPPAEGLFFQNTKVALGRTTKDPKLLGDLRTRKMDFSCVNGNALSSQVFDEVVHLEEITALIILKCLAMYKAYTGREVKGCVITVPAYYSDSQRAAVIVACQIASLENIRLLNEPTAAAIARLSANYDDGTYIVCDFGGGTFDVSVVTKSTEAGKITYAVEATAGNNLLGGNNCTDVLVGIATEELKKIGNAEICSNELWAVCESAKKQASTKRLEIRYRGLVVFIARDVYRKRLQRIFKSCRTIIERALERNNWQDISGVILAGGATYQFGFEEEVIDKTLPNIPRLPRLPASEIVSLGAAYATKSEKYIIRDITSRDLGIETGDPDTDEDGAARRPRGRKRKRNEHIMHIMIPKHSPVPTRKVFKTKTRGDKTKIQLLEGPDAVSTNNEVLREADHDTKEGDEITVILDVTRDSKVVAKTVFADGSEVILETKRMESVFTRPEIEYMRAKAAARSTSEADESKSATPPPKSGRQLRARQ